MTDATEERAADAYCQALCARHYENFIVASRVAPLHLRRDLARVYAYCRTTDDFGDESGPAALARLSAWRAQVEALFAGEAVIHPVLVALRTTVQRHHLPAQPFLDLIAANVQDQTVTSYEEWPALRSYCLLSAAPVGRIVLRLFGITNPAAVALSDDVCIGLQLANFAQDPSRDEAKGRCYLLQSEVRSLGVRGAVRAHCERARGLLASGRILEGMTGGRLRFQLALYRLGGLAILAAIERMGYATDVRRPALGWPAKILTLCSALGASVKGNGYVGSTEVA